MENSKKIFNLSMKESRKELEQSIISNLKKATSSDELKINREITSDTIKDYHNNNSINNQSIMDKYKKEIVGNSNSEPIVPTTKPYNEKRSQSNYQDNSIIMNHVYNEKLKNNTQEITSRLTNINKNDNS